MDKFLLDACYIKPDCESDMITCGDPESSGSNKINLVWEGDDIKSVDGGKVLAVNRKDIWNSKSKLWSGIAELFLTDLAPTKKISPQKPGNSWAIFQDEPPQATLDIQVVSEEDNGGEFSNDDHAHSGKVYIRYQLQDEVFDEKVVVFG